MKTETANLKYRFAVEQRADLTVHQLYFYDEIRAVGDFDWETWTYEESETSAKYIKAALDEIPDGETIEIHINSAGGEVGEGVSIYNLLRQKAGRGSKIVGYVDGYAYSVAADIAMAADELHMGLGTSMLIHYPWMVVAGNADQLLTYAEQLEALGDAAVQLYLERSRGLATEAEIRDLMKREAVLTPDMCLKYGFCEVVDKYDQGEEGEKPEELRGQMMQETQNRLTSAFSSMTEALKAREGSSRPDPDPEPKQKEPDNDMFNTFIAALAATGGRK